MRMLWNVNKIRKRIEFKLFGFWRQSTVDRTPGKTEITAYIYVDIDYNVHVALPLNNN